MKHRIRRTWHRKTAALAAAVMAMSFGSISYAMPQEGNIRSGAGEITRPDDKTMAINQKTERMAIDWKNFDIHNDEKVQFRQPDAQAIALNRVTGDAKSVLDGTLTANGRIYVVNPNGVLFGKNASVDVGSLVASTANISDDAMKNFADSKDPLTLSLQDNSSAQVINEGTIKAQGGLVALHAASVVNDGTIQNEGGKVALAAAKNITLAEDSAGKINFTVDGALAKASTLNSGVLQSDGGYVLMTAKQAGDVMSTVVNNTGTIEARTLRQNEKGEILLDGGDNGVVEVSNTIDASGIKNNQSAGSIKVIGQKTVVHDNTNLLARGDVDGGKIETSGDVLNLGDNLHIDAKGEIGKAGEWLLDPLEVIISDTQGSYSDYTTNTGGTISGGSSKNNVFYNDVIGKNGDASSTSSSTTWIDSKQVADILSKGTDITIQAISSTGAASITLNSPIDITIATSATQNPTFTLEANRNITINSPITAKSAGKGLNIMLNADTDGDAIGAVIINADIQTNGGNFTSATGGTVIPKSVTNTAGYNQYTNSSINWNTPVRVSGAPNPNGSTVGTYFGDAEAANGAKNRTINTNGGSITLNGEVAIGLNGGSINLLTNGGALTITGIINSGNSYDSYIYDSTTGTWNKSSDDAVIQKINTLVDSALEDDGSVPMYQYRGINYTKDANGNITGWTYDAVYYDKSSDGYPTHYVFRPLTADEANDTNSRITSNTNDGTAEDIKNFSHTLVTSNPAWYLTAQAGWGFNSFIVTGQANLTINDFLTYLKNTYRKKSDFTARYPDETYNDSFKANATEMANLKADITAYIAHNWYVAEELAETGSKGKGDQVGDSYLATITTRLENSLTTPNSSSTLWVGGRGSGIRNRTFDTDHNNVVTWYPADATHPDGFYWVTGPEGMVTSSESTYNNTTIGAGTKFWDTSNTNAQKDSSNSGTLVYGEAHWSSNKTSHQPDDNGPFLTVGYGSDNEWDDANFGGETTWGFVRETNLAHSSLNIQAGSGAVNLQGNVGGSVALDTVTINTTGAVITGGSSTTDYNVGTINTDHGIDITGSDVTICGRMQSGSTTDSANASATDNITVKATGDITVHGITANGKTDANGNLVKGGKIALTSTGANGTITLEKAEHTDSQNDAVANNGELIAAGTDSSAVIIDAQGKRGSFVNDTTGNSAITTGTGGSWKIYSAAPDLDTFGSNLDSHTDAMWTSKSDQNTVTDVNTADSKLGIYNRSNAADTGASGKYIFQATPTITMTADSYTKTYGDTFGDNTTESTKNEDLTAANMYNDLTYSRTYKDSSGNTKDLSTYKDAFQEKDPENYVDGTVTVSSKGAAAAATRTDGDIKDKDDKKSIYTVGVDLSSATGLNGYALAKVDGQLTINPRALTVSGTGEQTYGDPTITKWTDTTSGLLFGAKAVYGDVEKTNAVIKTGSSYYKNLQNHTSGKTADAGSYTDAMESSNFTNIQIKGSDGTDMSANYTITTRGDLTVKPAELKLTVNDATTEYGTAFAEETGLNNKHYDYTVGTVVNGDDPNTIKNLLGDLSAYENKGVGTGSRVTQDVGTYAINGMLSDEQRKKVSNYTIAIDPGTATITPKTITVSTPDITTTYGTVKPGEGSSLIGLTNGDQNDTTGITYTYDYGGGYLDNNSRTNRIGDYTVTTTGAEGKDYLKNYVITPGTSNLHIDPKDVYVRVDGRGETTKNVVYVDPQIDSKLSYGDHYDWTPALGGQSGDYTYHVITTIGGKSFAPGDQQVIDNYRFHYDGAAVVSPSKPDITPPVDPPKVPGNGGYTPAVPTNPSEPENGQTDKTVQKDWDGHDYGPGADREKHIVEVQLPFFKINDGKMTNYGTYNVKSEAAKVEISPTGKRLPEPDQPKTQYREYTKELTTDAGTGLFRLIYNGSTFHVMPLDDAARAMMQTGDSQHNVELFAKALHTGFSEMGIVPADLDGVYANFQDIAAAALQADK